MLIIGEHCCSRSVQLFAIESSYSPGCSELFKVSNSCSARTIRPALFVLTQIAEARLNLAQFAASCFLNIVISTISVPYTGLSTIDVL